jgi:hypothetical protein
MDAISKPQQALSQQFAEIATSGAMAQIAVPGLAVAAARLLRARWSRHVDSLLASRGDHGFRSLILRGSRRLAFPVSLALMALVAHAVFRELGTATGLLDPNQKAGQHRQP